MRLIALFSTLISLLILSGCAQKGTNPADPYEPINRKIHQFNTTVDSIALKPAAKVYKAVLPTFIRCSINNAYNNVLMLPTAVNDLLQCDWPHAVKDSWRFFFNSTFGVAGLFDVADKGFCLPPHYNDLGLTFAKWGYKNSTYIVLPLLGPSTIRDALALPFDYLFTPYPYLPGSIALTSLAGLRYVDLRSQLLDTERVLEEAFDKYTFIRDAYLQHRNFLIRGEQACAECDTVYVDEEEAPPSDYVDEN